MCAPTIELPGGRLHPLTDTQYAGLGWPWWVHQGCDFVAQATRCGFLDHWIRRVNLAIADNRKHAAWRPTDCRQLINRLQINSNHYYATYRSCQSDRATEPGTILRYLHATALGVPEHELAPTLAEWVSLSTVWLAKLDEASPPISITAARAYTTYVLARVDHRGRPMGAETISWLASSIEEICPVEPVRAILDTGETVGAILLKEDPAVMSQISHWNPPPDWMEESCAPDQPSPPPRSSMTT